MTKNEKKVYMVKYRALNKDAIARKQAEYRSKHKERRNAQSRAWRAENKEYLAMRNKEYKEKHKERISNQVREARAENQYKFTALQAKRNSAKKHRTPAWANMDSIRAVYKKASEMMGDYHVDHIIPLQGRLVSGLHIASNLQVIPALDNISKGNRYIIDVEV